MWVCGDSRAEHFRAINVQWIGQWGLFGRCSGSENQNKLHVLIRLDGSTPAASTHISFIINNLLTIINVAQMVFCRGSCAGLLWQHSTLVFIRATFYFAELEAGLPRLADTKTLVFWALKDRGSSAVRANSPNHKTIEFPNANHFFFEDEADTMIRAIRAFMAEGPTEQMTASKIALTRSLVKRDSLSMVARRLKSCRVLMIRRRFSKALFKIKGAGGNGTEPGHNGRPCSWGTLP